MTSTLKKWPIFSLLKPEFTSKIRMVVVFGYLGNSCLIVTKDQMVYGIGNNSEGCLGTGDRENSLHPKKINELCGKNIKTFAYGQEHVLALTENGELYAWGNNAYLQLGYSSGGSVPKRVHITADETNFVVDIACGARHSVVLTNDGMVYSWGKDRIKEHQQYYFEPINNCIKHMKLGTHDLIKCASISCGASHSVAVTQNGKVYAWGSNSAGQLGNGSTNSNSNPSEVVNLRGIVIVKVVCGMEHTLALTDKGSLYSWGDNQFGQLGIIMRNGNYSKSPLAISSLKNVLDMAASNSSNISVAMGIGHRIFMWGNCLGQSLTDPKFILVDSIHDAFALYASPNTMHQPLVLSDDIKDYKEKKETTRILDNLEAAFDDKNTSDVTIEVEGKPIYVHKAILRIRSEYFERMFQGPWQENNDSVVKEGHFSYVVYRAFLKFLYTGKIDIQAENGVELLQLADFCNDGNLKTRCVDLIMQGISADNAAFIYSVAVKYNAMVLKERCINFVVKNMTQVIESTSFAELSHEMMKAFIIEANKFKVFKT